ncbi:MarR family winged helix-turn-helix transcriptional regulator [Paenibacillus lutrae]
MSMNIHESDSMMQIMSRVIKLHRRHLHNQLQDYEVFPGQPPLLIRLAEKDGQSQNELAGQMRVKPATLTVMISRMEKTGLVERRADSKDMRVSRVYLTSKGHQATEAVKKTLAKIENVSLEQFTLEERLLFRRFLLHVYDNLNELDDSLD